MAQAAESQSEAPTGNVTSEGQDLGQTEPLLPDTSGNDADSAYGESIASGDSSSLASSVLNYQYENGRRYHGFRKDRGYFLPNDEDEQDRLDMLHHIFRLLLHGDHYRAPIKEPKRILDVGTGTAIWAIEVADEHPDATVVGVDLSPIAPGWVPPNLRVYVDDIEEPWGYLEHERFDFIHSRALAGCLADWPKMIRQAFDNLRPGGWYEAQEYDCHVYSDDDTRKSAVWLADWEEQLNVAGEKLGRPMSIVGSLQQWMEEAGFVDVQSEVHKVPIGPWAKGKEMKQLGIFYRLQVLEAVEPFTLALYTRALGYTVEQAQVVIAKTKGDVMNPKFHIYVPYVFVWGRKPE